MGAIDMTVQRDLHRKLEAERHQNAALSFELERRARESEDLRRQLEEAKNGDLAKGTTSTIKVLQPVVQLVSHSRVPSHSLLPQTRATYSLGSGSFKPPAAESATVSCASPRPSVWRCTASTESGASSPVSPASPRHAAWPRNGATLSKSASLSVATFYAGAASPPSPRHGLTSAKSVQTLSHRKSDAQLPQRTTSVSNLNSPASSSLANVAVS